MPLRDKQDKSIHACESPKRCLAALSGGPRGERGAVRDAGGPDASAVRAPSRRSSKRVVGLECLRAHAGAHRAPIPFDAIERLVAAAPRATLEAVDAEHFDVDTGDHFDRLAPLEARFLAGHLGSRPAPAEGDPGDVSVCSNGPRAVEAPE